MSRVVVEALSKHYRIARRQPGLWGALRGLLAREYRVMRALDGISFGIEPGELVGFIGPNGAGKSTTVKLLSGILVPDGGRCEVDGRVPWRDRVAHVAQIGVVFGQRSQLWWDLPAADSFELLRRIYAVPSPAFAERLAKLSDAMDIGAVLDVPVRQLSLGQRMRCELVAALLHDPRLLVLDEPTVGLDAAAKLALRGFVRELARRGDTTVLLTTHDMDDIEALCRRVIVIDAGRIFVEGSLDELRARMGGERRLVVEMSDPSIDLSTVPAAVVRREGGRVELRYDPASVATPELVARVAALPGVRDLFLHDPPIEEIVARLYDAAARQGSP